jgi:Cd2+/Zn2+-exporting ATPase
MGVAGSDAALEAADLAVMADDLSKLVYAVRIGRKAGRVSRQNVVFSQIVLAVLIPAAVLGPITTTVAAPAHEASVLLAVANGLRAGRPLGMWPPRQSLWIRQGLAVGCWLDSARIFAYNILN